MLGQPLQRAKERMAEIALVTAPIGVIRLLVGLVVGRTLVADQILGEDTSRILAAYELVQRIAVHFAGLWAGAGFEVVRHPRGCDPTAPTEGAPNTLAQVSAGVKML